MHIQIANRLYYYYTGNKAFPPNFTHTVTQLNSPSPLLWSQQSTFMSTTITNKTQNDM